MSEPALRNGTSSLDNPSGGAFEALFSRGQVLKGLGAGIVLAGLLPSMYARPALAADQKTTWRQILMIAGTLTLESVLDQGDQDYRRKVYKSCHIDFLMVRPNADEAFESVVTRWSSEYHETYAEYEIPYSYREDGSDAQEMERLYGNDQNNGLVILLERSDGEGTYDLRWFMPELETVWSDSQGDSGSGFQSMDPGANIRDLSDVPLETPPLNSSVTDGDPTEFEGQATEARGFCAPASRRVLPFRWSILDCSADRSSVDMPGGHFLRRTSETAVKAKFA
jgi:hypothetical protein